MKEGEALKIKDLTFTNFRGFIDEEFSFCNKDGSIRNFTLLVGDNGVGKTSVLEGIVKAISPIMLLINKNVGDDINLADKDINVNKLWTSLNVNIEIQNKKFDWFNSKRRSSAVTDWVGTPAKSQREIKEYISKELFSQNEIQYVPLVLYYSTARMVIDVPMRAKTSRIDNPMKALDNCLSVKNNFRRFFEWFKGEEENELRMIRDINILSEDTKYSSRSLDAVRKAIGKMMRGYSDLKIKPHPTRMVITNPNNEEIRIEQLSGGYKAIFSLVSDIASRLAQANPNATNPLECSALILIDELDMHLHPKWQRTIARDLQNVFPNCQFIATTHSPSVIQSLNSEQVMNLEEEKKYEEDYRGWSVDEILEYKMGLENTKTNEYTQAIKEFEEALDDENVEIAKQAYNNIKRMIHPYNELGKLLKIQLAGIGGQVDD